MLELLVALAIVAILAAIALPNYAEHVARGRRTRAQLDLIEATQYLQRYYAAFNSFTGAALPQALARSPHDGAAAYAIVLAVDDDGLGFVVSAKPQDPYTGDRCGILAMRSTGLKSNASGQPIETCWR